MKKSRTFMIIELLLAAFAILCIVMMVRSRTVPEKKIISVIVEDSENDIWAPLKDGTQEAGKENNTDIRFVTTGTFDNAEDEIKTIDDAVSEGCDGIMVYPINETAARMIRKKSYKIPVLLIIADSEQNLRSISMDAENSGKKLAEMIIEDNGSGAGKSIGIITDKRYERIAKQIKSGLDSVLKTTEYKQTYFRKGANEDYIRYHRPDILICLDEGALSIASELSGAQRLPGVSIYGCGFAPTDVYQLDMENIKGLVYPDVFKIGYYGVTEITERLHGNLTQPQSRVVKSRTLRKGDIFKDDSVLDTFSRK